MKRILRPLTKFGTGLNRIKPDLSRRLGLLIEASIPPLLLDDARREFVPRYGEIGATHEVAANVFGSAITDPSFWRAYTLQDAPLIERALQRLTEKPIYSQSRLIEDWPSFVRGVAEIMGGKGDSSSTFSLSAATGLERLARQIENRPSTPKEKAKIFNRMAADLAGMARSVALNEGNDVLTRISEIRQESKALRAKLQDEYENEALADGAGDILSNADLAKVRGQPFMAWLTENTQGSRLRSRLMSRTRAAREGRYDPTVHGDFDGASGIPAILFNGNQMPDQVAHEAYQEGALPEDSVDALWQKIHEELAAVETWRQRVRKAEDAEP